MRPIHRAYWLFLGALTLLPPPVFGATPKAAIKAPPTASPDAEVWLKFAGSVSDQPLVVILAEGPDEAAVGLPVDVSLLFDSSGKSVYGVTKFARPGLYLLMAHAKGVPEGAKESADAFAWTRVMVGAVPPTPNPNPTPTPIPTPTPLPNPSPPTPGASLSRVGQYYGPQLAETYAAGWDAAATALEAGKPVAECQQLLQQVWQAERTKSFGTHVKPALNAILPEGVDPADPAQRAAIAAYWRDFAKGLRGGK